MSGYPGPTAAVTTTAIAAAPVILHHWQCMSDIHHSVCASPNLCLEIVHLLHRRPQPCNRFVTPCALLNSAQHSQLTSTFVTMFLAVQARISSPLVRAAPRAARPAVVRPESLRATVTYLWPSAPTDKGIICVDKLCGSVCSLSDMIRCGEPGKTSPPLTANTPVTCRCCDGHLRGRGAALLPMT